MKALIDGDLILYAACHVVQNRWYVAYEGGEPMACSTRKRDLEGYTDIQVCTTIDEDSYWRGTRVIYEKVESIIEEVGADDATVYLTGAGNFRLELYPEYKSHRPEKPVLYLQLKDYMVNHMDFHVELVEGMEADDALGINQSTDTIICSYDKDLRMIPGKHYDFRKQVFFEVHPVTAMRTFYCQVLTGDSTDNIPGLHRVGPATALKVLEGATTEEEMWDRVLTAYAAQDIGEEEAIRNAQLIWIMRKEGTVWSPPNAQV